MSTRTSSELTRVTHFTQELTVALLNLDLYAPNNGHVRDSIHNMMFELAAFYAVDETTRLRIDLRDSALQFEGEPLMGPTLQAGRLIQLLKSRGIASMVFGVDLDGDELLRFLMLLTSDVDRDAFRAHNRQRALSQQAIHNITVLQEHEVQGTPPQAPFPAPPIDDAAVRDYQGLASILQESHVAAHRGEGLEIARAEGLVEQAVQQMASEPSRLLALATYDEIDSFTVGHSVRVALLALQVAEAAGISRRDMVRVGTAGLLHDIGKSRIPQEVLFKRGPLTHEEREIMAQHPRLGGEILLQQQNLDPTAIGAAFCHHMSPDQRGYPTPALPFEPSGVSKLVRVCDVFEALTAVRPYKRALQPVEAYVVMLRMKDGFDPAWLRFFIHVLGIHPPGTKVTLSTGEQGLVTAPGATPDCPEVRILTDATGHPLPSHEQFVVPIGAEDRDDGLLRSIVKAHGSGDLSHAHRDIGEGDCGEDDHGPKHDHGQEHDADRGKGVDSCCGEPLVEPETNE